MNGKVNKTKVFAATDVTDDVFEGRQLTAGAGHALAAIR